MARKWTRVGLNHRPSLYKNAALPLSYGSVLLVDVIHVGRDFIARLSVWGSRLFGMDSRRKVVPRRRSLLGKRLYAITDPDVAARNIESGRKRLAAMAVLYAREHHVSLEAAVRELGARDAAASAIVKLGRKMRSKWS